jgi:hypothetical protein
MINPDLERRFADCSELVEAWRLFLDLVNRAIKSPDALTHEMEQDFLSTKARIAMLFDSFVEGIKHDRAVASNMIGIVNRAITLKALTRMSPAEAKKLEIEWHEVYLLLNETVSNMEEQRSDLANVNELAWKLGRVKERLQVQIKGFFSSIYFKIMLGVGALVFIIFGVPAFGIYDWDNLRDQGWARVIVANTLNFTRNAMGFNSPFYDMDQFMGILLDGPTPGLSHENITNVVNQGNAIIGITQQVHTFTPGFDGKTLAQHLQGAMGYQLLKFANDEGSVNAYAFIFWFRKSADAEALYSTYLANQKHIPDNYIFIKKVNVITVMRSEGLPRDRANQFLTTVKSKRFDLVKPFN